MDEVSSASAQLQVKTATGLVRGAAIGQTVPRFHHPAGGPAGSVDAPTIRHNRAAAGW